MCIADRVPSVAAPHTAVPAHGMRNEIAAREAALSRTNDMGGFDSEHGVGADAQRAEQQRLSRWHSLGVSQSRRTTVADKSARRNAGKAATRDNTAASVGQVAEYIGSSLADLMNRKDALARQLADVNGQIAAARKRVTAKVTQALPQLERLRGGGGTAAAGKKKSIKAGAKKGNGKRKRPLPPDDPMVAATERARAAEAKGRAANRARTSQRSGNR